MKLISNWSAGALFWRTFTAQDTVYIVGLRQGFLSNGATMTYDHPSGQFQMELKRGDLAGPILVAAGRIFSDDDELIFTDSGQLIATQDAAVVVVDPGFKFEFYGSVVQFLSTGSADATIKLTSSLSQTTTTNNAHTTTVTSSASNETGGQVGQDASAEGSINQIKLGAKTSAQLSGKIIAKIEQVVANTLSVQVATTTAYADEQTITLKAGKLTAITSSWQRRYVTGTVALGHESYPYDATLGYVTSRLISEFASPDALPPDLMAQYMLQNPDYLPPSLSQSDWRWCHKCTGLFFSGGQLTAGSCPAGGTHDRTGSGNYALAHNAPSASGQSDWRWCHKCQGLFFSGGQAAAGACPSGGAHEKSWSGNYTLPHNSSTTGQRDWRWCHKCQGLFFSGGQAVAGTCPSGGAHDVGTSGMYTLRSVSG